MYICLYVYIYVYIHISIYACMYVCMHVCMYVCLYVHTDCLLPPPIVSSDNFFLLGKCALQAKSISGESKTKKEDSFPPTNG